MRARFYATSGRQFGAGLVPRAGSALLAAAEVADVVQGHAGGFGKLLLRPVALESAAAGGLGRALPPDTVLDDRDPVPDHPNPILDRHERSSDHPEPILDPPEPLRDPREPFLDHPGPLLHPGGCLLDHRDAIPDHPDDSKCIAMQFRIIPMIQNASRYISNHRDTFRRTLANVQSVQGLDTCRIGSVQNRFGS